MSAVSIQTQAVDVLVELAEDGRSLPDPAVLRDLTLFDMPGADDRIVWNEREMQVLTTPGAQLPQVASRDECNQLLVAAINRCREVGVDLALTSDDNILIPSGVQVPGKFFRMAVETSGGNLPDDEDCLAVEVVRQAFLSSGPPVTRGVPAMRWFRERRSDRGAGERQGTGRAGEDNFEAGAGSFIVAYQGDRTTQVHKLIRDVARHWGKVTDTVWVVKYDGSSADLLSLLRSKAGYGKLLVSRAGGDVSSRNLGESIESWVGSHMGVVALSE